MFDLILSIIILAAIALFIGAVVLWRKGVRKQAGLMALLSFVMIANAAIWLAPMEDGTTPAEHAAGAVEEEAGRN
ncbi:hypothetical protein [Aurantiacibacter gangjinensis]|uniref:Uncharacterized protein n=1 Tax=Aurantiacibacter gangjinensis TaxID=502682 RepID=A0A0G9MSH4_9SPHN|nr:hypothetical protein [Aurantiacibacter gangjinensis]APE29190.1 hypothetical protein BMF35_a2361 [Aurantiacibacter gangjinensis]KLE33687.1 hypothetical protein AAW01_04680 [Aurantiacibacter gangjinensis]